jgi:hypothetical protein
MGVVIDEVEVEAVERETRSERRGMGDGQGQSSGPQRLDPNELAAVLMKHAERLQRLWAD